MLYYVANIKEGRMLHFESDYNNGCHEEILKALVETNSTFENGYGDDQYTKLAEERIKKACKCPDGQVFLLTGGTQTNAVVISSILKPWQGAVCAQTGHIHDHEAGALEHTGHKTLPIAQKNGKISAKDLKTYIENFYKDGNYQHKVFPGLVYISMATELGTVYSKKELTDIYQVCKDNKITLFIDGARLGYALMSKKSDLTLPQICKLCDVIYIGGTKVGALCGEAVVFTHNNAPENFFTMVKQNGALLAKGRLLGVQFATLFNKDLYFKISEHAIKQADELKKILKKKGYKFYLETPTNQQFVIVENKKLTQLKKKVVYAFWDLYDKNHTVIRFCTSWATTDEDLKALEKVL